MFYKVTTNCGSGIRRSRGNLAGKRARRWPPEFRRISEAINLLNKLGDRPFDTDLD